MNRLVGMALAAACAILVTGCGIEGHWVVQEETMNEPSGSFEFASVKLNRDGTYEATSMYEGEERVSMGTYDWDKKSNWLTFKTDTGREIAYPVFLQDMCSTMKVVVAEDEMDERIVRMKRK